MFTREMEEQGFKGIVGQWLLLRPTDQDDLGDPSKVELVARDADFSVVSDLDVIRKERLEGSYSDGELPFIAQVIDRKHYDLARSAHGQAVALRPLDGGFGSMDPWEWRGEYQVLPGLIPDVGEQGEAKMTYARLYPLIAKNVQITFDVLWPPGLPPNAVTSE